MKIGDPVVHRNFNKAGHIVDIGRVNGEFWVKWYRTIYEKSTMLKYFLKPQLYQAKDLKFRRWDRNAGFVWGEIKEVK